MYRFIYRFTNVRMYRFIYRFTNVRMYRFIFRFIIFISPPSEGQGGGFNLSPLLRRGKGEVSTYLPSFGGAGGGP